MLYLNPPFHVIDGLSLLPDHEDRLQYYFMPLAPKLTVVPDPATGKRVPSLQFVQYRGGAGDGGLLNFDCNLGVEQDVIDSVAAQVKQKMNLRQTPRLSPVPLVDGTVKVLLLGQSSPAPGAPTSPGAPPGTAPAPVPRFVTKIDHHASPALFGTNQVAVSVALDRDGAVMLSKALLGEMSPIGIVYSLDFLALRPAYSVRLNVDWDRVQKHFDEQYGVDAIFFSTQINETVDELIEKRFIDLQVDTFVPEGEKDSEIITRRDQAVEEVRDMMTAAFFTPSIDPTKEAKDGWDRLAWMAQRATAIAVTGGWGAVGTFSYKKTHYTRIDKKVLNVNLRERTTIKRSIYPQGHLSGLARLIEAEGFDPQDFVFNVDLDDPYFAKRQVKVIARGNFEEDAIGSLDVRLRYGSEPRNVILEASGASASLSWASQLTAGGMQREVASSFRVNFKGVDGSERPIALESPERIVGLDVLEINPRELYSVVSVPIAGVNFPFERYPRVEIQLEYVDEPNGIRMNDLVALTKDAPQAVWRMFVRDPRRRTFRQRITFRGADHRDLERPWVESDEEQVLIRDPFPMKRVVDVVPMVPWTEVQQAFADLTYEDKANDVLETRSLAFSETDAAPKSFSVELRDPGQRRVAFEVSLMFKDGRLVQVPRSFTLAPRIFLRPDMRGHRIVSLRTERVDFASRGVKQIKVATRYEDPEHGLSIADEATFTDASESAAFEFDYVDAQKAAYEVKVTQLFANGMVKAGEWARSDEDELVVKVG